MEVICYCGIELKNIKITNHEYGIYEVSAKCKCGHNYEAIDRGYCEDLFEAKRILSNDYSLTINLKTKL